METIANVEPVAVCARVMQIFFGSFIYIYLIAKLVGPDNKLAWFRKRKKYILFLTAVVFSVRILTLVILYAGKAFCFPGDLRRSFRLWLLVYFRTRLLS